MTVQDSNESKRRKVDEQENQELNSEKLNVIEKDKETDEKNDENDAGKNPENGSKKSSPLKQDEINPRKEMGPENDQTPAISTPTMTKRLFGSSFTGATFGSLASTISPQHGFGMSKSLTKTDSDSLSDALVSDKSPVKENSILSTTSQSVPPSKAIPLVVTGEEGESTFINMRAKLYIFDKNKNDWRERGVGHVKLNVKQELDEKEGTKNQARLLMRAEGSLRLLLNIRLFNGMNLEIVQEKNIRLVTFDEEANQLQSYLLRLRSMEDAESFMVAIQQHIRIEDTKKQHPLSISSSE